jgi:hypothetical protein
MDKKKLSLKEKETAKLYDALIVIVLAIVQAFACHREGTTIVEVKIVRIVIAQKQVNVQTVKDNIKFLHQAVLYSRNSKTKDKSTEPYKHPVQIVKMRIFFINCQSFKTAYGLSDTIEKYDIDVLCLNETFEKDKNRVFYKDWKIYSPPSLDQIKPEVELQFA